MIDCPCGFGRELTADRPNCPVCGADVTPLHRLEEARRTVSEFAGAHDQKLETERAGYRSQTVRLRRWAAAGCVGAFLSGLGVMAVIGKVERRPAPRPGAASLAAAVRQSLAANPQTRSLALDVAPAGEALRIAGQAPTEAHRELVLALAAQAGAPARIQAYLSVPPPAPEPRRYTVRPGDSLGRIAVRLCGDAASWVRVYEANRGQLRDPSRLFPGQVLVIPSSGADK